MVDLEARVREVLQRGYILSLGTVDESGVWVSDVAYVASSKGIYWMSYPVARHSRAIAKRPQVAGTIRVSAPGEPDLALQIAGTARRILEPRPDIAEAYQRKRGRDPKSEHELLTGRSWYALEIDVIELIDEIHFGFTKQRIDR